MARRCNMENCDTEANHYDLRLSVALLRGRLHVTVDLCQRHLVLLEERTGQPVFTGVVVLP